jgi:iron complex outermembrane receptor protein
MKFLSRLFNKTTFLILTYCFSGFAFNETIAQNLPKSANNFKKIDKQNFSKEVSQTNILATTKVIAQKSSLTANNFENNQNKNSKIAGSVSMIKQDDLQKNYSSTLKDMLDYAPGVLSQSKAGQESRLSIRGSGLSRTYHLRGINLYQDGIPINLADGSADFQDLDPLAFDHVEIFKGANGLHLGSGSLGGAINFVSPTGYTANALKLRVEAGSFETARGNISSGKVIGKFDYFSSLTAFKSTGFRQQNQQEDTKFYSNFGYKINDNTENRTYLTFVNSNLELPGAITRTQMNSNPKIANANNLTSKQERNYNQLRLANKTSFNYDNQAFNIGFYSNLKDLDHPIFQVIDQQTQNYGIFADGKIKNKLFGLENELNFGTNFNYGNTNSKRFLNVNGSATSLTVKGDEKSYNANFFAENILKLTAKTSINFGGQFLTAIRDYKDRFLSDGNQSGTRKYYGISPKIGSLYELDKHTQIFANLSGAYEPPTFSESRQTTNSGLANISAQKSYTFEIGSRRNNQKTNWDFTLYRSHLKDELILYTIAPNITQAINANRTIHQGIELGFDSIIWSKNSLQNIHENYDKIADILKFRTIYTLNDFRFDNDKIYQNNQIPGAPRHYIRSELNYKNSMGFYIAPNFEISPNGFYVDSKNSVKTPNYFLLGITAGYDINKNIAIYLDGKNLLNKKYSPTADVLSTANNSNPAVYYPANSRGIYGGIKMQW